MVNVFIIHGSYGHPKENWFPWLKAKLEKEGCKVFIPKFPTPKGQKLKTWLSKLKKYDKYLDQDTVLIGHSMGCALILRKLELLKKPVKEVLLIGGFTKDLWQGEYKDIIDTFFEKPFDWKKIKSKAEHFEVYQSNNDPFVPFSMGKDIAKRLGSKFIQVKGAGHFNREAGYTKFNLLFKRVNLYNSLTNH